MENKGPLFPESDTEIDRRPHRPHNPAHEREIQRRTSTPHCDQRDAFVRPTATLSLKYRMLKAAPSCGLLFFVLTT
jgi:hypothetical protein